MLFMFWLWLCEGLMKAFHSDFLLRQFDVIVIQIIVFVSNARDFPSKCSRVRVERFHATLEIIETIEEIRLEIRSEECADFRTE